MTQETQMNSNTTIRGALAALAAAAAMAGTGALQAADFKGKTVRVVIGYAAGGGYDTYGRQVARHIGRHLPGKPIVVAQNRPGAGSLNAVNYIYYQAPKDGTVFATFARSVPLLAFSGQSKQAKFDPTKLTWIGTSSSYQGEAYLMVVRKDTGIRSINDLRKAEKPLNFASTSFGSDGTDVPAVLRDILGINVQPLRGYPGGNTLYLAVERGEAQARMVGYASMKTAQPGWLKPDSPVRVILQFATKTRLPDFPDAPTALEVVTKQDDKDLIAMMETPFYLARPFAAPPGLKPDVTAALREGFMKAHADPKYKADAERLRLLTSPLDGAEVQKLIERLGKMNPALFARYAKILENPKSPLRKVQWTKVQGEIAKLGKKGRFQFKVAGKDKAEEARVGEDGYTEITINGKKAKDKDLKAGMKCEMLYEGPGSYAGKLTCTM
ncbi:MAG: tripartite tricarboxylate transporter substrate-binding protein [Alphaproteobacteria bacterium]|nr:tripartite tricarboxylate transporter substrate-binding protein [Alphaproteobacteria bacterium]